jgi:hypothetical protein
MGGSWFGLGAAPVVVVDDVEVGVLDVVVVVDGDVTAQVGSAGRLSGGQPIVVVVVLGVSHVFTSC